MPATFCMLVSVRSTELRRTSRGSQLSLVLANIRSEHAVAPDDHAVFIDLVVDRDVQVHGRVVRAGARDRVDGQHGASRRRRQRGLFFRSRAVVVVFEIADHARVAVDCVRRRVCGHAQR